ncbi:MAG: glucokinase [Nanoarchaeota archaeon]|nr:glucokinase [Nanoarchaeota archaeon]
MVAHCFFDGQITTNFKTQVLEDVLNKSSFRPQDITRMVLAAAGPTDGKTCQMTNARFFLDTSQYGIKSVIINDFEGVSEGIGSHILRFQELKLLLLPHLDGSYGDAFPLGNIGILGAGTGLGEGRLFFSNNRYKPKASEGGHKFLPTDSTKPEEIEIARYLSSRYYGGRIPHSESVLSGRGTEHVFDYLLARSIARGEFNLPNSAIEEFEGTKDKPEAISRLAKKYPDTIFGKTEDFFYRVYGRASHDLVVHENARDGLYIAGGIMRKNIEINPGSAIIDKRVLRPFMEEFDNGPSHRDWVNKTRVYVVMDKEVGLKGAKYVASNPEVFNEKL